MQGILREKSPHRRESIGHVTFEDDPPSPRKPQLRRQESGIFQPLNSEANYAPNSYIIFENSDEESDQVVENEGIVSIKTSNQETPDNISIKTYETARRQRHQRQLQKMEEDQQSSPMRQFTIKTPQNLQKRISKSPNQSMTMSDLTDIETNMNSSKQAKNDDFLSSYKMRIKKKYSQNQYFNEIRTYNKKPEEAPLLTQNLMSSPNSKSGPKNFSNQSRLRNTSPRLFDSFQKSDENADKAEQKKLKNKVVTHSDRLISVSPRLSQKGFNHNSQPFLTTYKSKKALEHTISAFNLTKSNDQQQPELSSIRSENEQLKETIKQIKINNELLLQNDLAQDLQKVKNKNLHLIKENEKLKTELLEQKMTVKDLKSRVSTQESMIQSLNQSVNVLDQDVQQITKEKDELYVQNKDFITKVDKMEQQLLECDYVSHQQLQQQIQNYQQQLKLFKGNVQKLLDVNHYLESNQPLYIPKKIDKIDIALAEFVNGRRQKLQILFLRESEGVYKFGTKRVTIKVQLNGQIMVRIGGGYISIDQFIEIYQQAEVEKISEKRINEVARFQKKVKVGFQKNAKSPLKSSRAPSTSSNGSRRQSIAQKSLSKKVQYTPLSRNSRVQSKLDTISKFDESRESSIESCRDYSRMSEVKSRLSQMESRLSRVEQSYSPQKPMNTKKQGNKTKLNTTRNFKSLFMID